MNSDTDYKLQYRDGLDHSNQRPQRHQVELNIKYRYLQEQRNQGRHQDSFPVPYVDQYQTDSYQGNPSSHLAEFQTGFQSTLPKSYQPSVPHPHAEFAESPNFSRIKSQYPQTLLPYNSEWIDSPTVSPSKPEMLTTKLETPKTSKTFVYITPKSHKQGDISRGTSHPDSNIDSHTSNVEFYAASRPDSPLTSLTNSLSQNPRPHNVKVWDIFWAMLNDITGKDKMAKIGQYSLRLFLYHAEKTQTYLSDETFNITTIRNRYDSKEKKLNLIRNFGHHPQNFMKILVIIVCSVFRTKLKSMVAGLATYRQFLRFGKSPFRLRTLINKFKENISLKNNSILDVNYQNLLTRKTLSEIFGLYYSFNDETNLLFKLKFYSNASFKKFAARHESLAWYYDTWLNLYNAYEKLQILQQQEMDLKIQIQVKNRAKALSKQLLIGESTILNTHVGGVSRDDKTHLNNIQFKKNNAYLDIYKNISDLVFNSYTVFRLTLPFDTLQIWMGISASVLSTVKLYRETKKLLIEKEMKKRV